MQLLDWAIIASIFVWCFGLSYYLWRLQVLVGRLLLRQAHTEQTLRQLREEGPDAD